MWIKTNVDYLVGNKNGCIFKLIDFGNNNVTSYRRSSKQKQTRLFGVNNLQ